MGIGSFVKKAVKQATSKTGMLTIATGGLYGWANSAQKKVGGWWNLALIAGSALATAGAGAAVTGASVGAGAAVGATTGGVAGGSTLGIVGGAAAGVAMTAPKAIAERKAQEAADKAQAAYDKETALEKARADASNRANLLSMRKNFIQSTTKAMHGGTSTSMSGEQGGIVLG